MRIFSEESNFLDIDTCEEVLQFYKKYYPKIGRPIDANRREGLDLYDCCHFLTTDSKINDADLIKKILSKITMHSDSILPGCFVNYAQIVKWNVGSYQPEHLDFDYHDLTSIIYLNDGYQGGETTIDEISVSREIGKIITFTGNTIKHSVTQVLDRERYTLAVWYKK